MSVKEVRSGEANTGAETCGAAPKCVLLSRHSLWKREKEVPPSAQSLRDGEGNSTKPKFHNLRLKT
jgi:hypothetical protein